MTEDPRNTDEPFSVVIEAEASPVPSVPAWLGEVALVAHTLGYGKDSFLGQPFEPVKS